MELTQGSSTYAYEVDGLGSVNRLTSSGGATSERYTYDAWGNPSASGSVSNSLQYAGRESDPTTGEVFDRARFYDPSADGGHRFLSQDPMGGGYAYVGDSPMNFVDPTGMKGHCAQCQLAPVYPTPAPAPRNPPSPMLCLAMEIGMMLDLVSGLALGVPLSLAGGLTGLIWTVVSGTIPSLAISIAAGDVIGILRQLAQLAIAVILAYIATPPWWEALAQLTAHFLDWGVSLAIALGTLAYDIYQFKQSGCM